MIIIIFLKYDDYGPPPDRWYPSRDYDRGAGYSEGERERPPSYSSDHYSSRFVEWCFSLRGVVKRVQGCHLCFHFTWHETWSYGNKVPWEVGWNMPLVIGILLRSVVQVVEVAAIPAVTGDMVHPWTEGMEPLIAMALMTEAIDQIVVTTAAATATTATTTTTTTTTTTMMLNHMKSIFYST